MQVFSPPSEHTAPHDRRGGFTLIEVLLVLAVLLVMASLVWPSLDWMYRQHRLRQAAESVRVRLSAARLRAVEAGFPYQFRFEPGGYRFVVLPTDVGSTAGPAAQAAPIAWKAAGSLPTKMRFDVPTTANVGAQPLAADLFTGLPDAQLLAAVNWSAPILFHTDGSADSVVLTLSDQQQQTVELSIRGLTGGVTVSKVQYKKAY
jgi:type II secretion system protein H